MFDISARINIAITDQAIGLWFGGDFHVKIGWWIFVAEESARGDLYFGFYRQQNGQMTFAVLAHGRAPVVRMSTSSLSGARMITHLRRIILV